MPPLVGPAREIEQLRAVLLALPGEPFNAENVIALGNPTLAEAKTQLYSILTGAGSEDNLLIYMSGHSGVGADQLSLLFADSDPRFPPEALSANTLSAALEITHASSVLLVLNTSYAGSFSLPDSPRLKDSPTSYYFIGSVGPTEPAFDPSPFAEALAGAIQLSTTAEHSLDAQQVFRALTDRLLPEGMRPFFAARGHLSRSDPEPVTSDKKSVFVSYSHRDERWLNKLRPHLDSLTWDIEIDYWNDKRIQPGGDWHQEIRHQLGNAAAAVLLVSADFLASEFIRNEELPSLLAQAEARRTRLFCLIIRPCRFDKVPVLSKFQAVNGPDRTLSEMPLPGQERTFLRLTDQLVQALR